MRNRTQKPPACTACTERSKNSANAVCEMMLAFGEKYAKENGLHNKLLDHASADKVLQTRLKFYPQIEFSHSLHPLKNCAFFFLRFFFFCCEKRTMQKCTSHRGKAASKKPRLVWRRLEKKTILICNKNGEAKAFASAIATTSFASVAIFMHFLVVCFFFSCKRAQMNILCLMRTNGARVKWAVGRRER